MTFNISKFNNFRNLLFFYEYSLNIFDAPVLVAIPLELKCWIFRNLIIDIGNPEFTKILDFPKINYRYWKPRIDVCDLKYLITTAGIHVYARSAKKCQ